MNKTTILTLALLAAVSFSFINAEPAVKKIAPMAIAENAALSKSEQLSAVAPGLSKEFLDYAVKGYNKMVAEGLVSNTKYFTIVDMSKSSREKRFYVIDMEKDSLVMNTYVAHGKKSGLDSAASFSNDMNSEKSSLGFYVTADTYNGKHGTSLRLKGLDKGFNDNAEQRGVVVHAADYVNEARVNSAYMGRSQGCPALPNDKIADAINFMKGGSALFIFNGDKNYTEISEFLK